MDYLNRLQFKHEFIVSIKNSGLIKLVELIILFYIERFFNLKNVF